MNYFKKLVSKDEMIKSAFQNYAKAKSRDIEAAINARDYDLHRKVFN